MITFGIDFGTTNTAVYSLDIDSKGNSLSDKYGEEEQPFSSLIALHQEKEAIYGRSVKKQRGRLRREGYTIVSSFKSMLGKNQPIAVGNKRYSPVDITVLFLDFVKKKVEAQAKTEMNEAVIAIPVDFKPEQRHDLREAAEKAGIHVKSFVSEPTAAYFFAQDDEEMKGASNVAVFDWGGGTLDVSLLSYDGKTVQEWAIAGKRLGGDDIDEILASHFHSCIMESGEVTNVVRFGELSPELRDQVIERSEQAKIVLSLEETASIRLLNYCGQSRVSETITQEEFDQLISGRIQEAEDVLRDAVNKARVSLAQLDAILMVGGSCSMRSIVKRLREIGETKMNGGIVYRPKDVQWAIAGGAAVLAQKTPSYLLDRALGVSLSDNSFYPIFDVGQTAPSEVITPRFGIVEDTQQAIFVFQDDKGNHLSFTDERGQVREYASVPTKGFKCENITAEASIDEDMIANVVLKSENQNEPVSIKFNQLPFSYHID